ncbi:MAG TPA: chemotaxis protein CheW [Vicinamibacteria bacterium]|nr:chemotaxis protein CheW [Vicinamibacteria bacterium]
MSDARKRARKAEPAPKAPDPVRPPEAPPPSRSRAIEAPEPAATGAWVAKDESFGFREEDVERPAAEKPGRMSLPSSGLAEDILAMAQAAEVTPAPSPPVPEKTQPALPAVANAEARAHAISFFATPLREERKAVEAAEHLATFFLAREEYGVDVRLVQEIIRVSEITQVPRAPEFIKGVINLRGRIIPVIDLKRKLGVGEVDVSSRPARIVVVKLKDRQVGLLVDGASQVLRVPLSSIEAAPDEVSEIDSHAIRGVAKLTDRLIILMDLEKVLSLELKEASQATS